MGRTCGEPDEIKKNTHPKIFTALFRERTVRSATLDTSEAMHSAVVGFVRDVFGCVECRDHFLGMVAGTPINTTTGVPWMGVGANARPAAASGADADAVAVARANEYWLFRAHNAVNVRLGNAVFSCAGCTPGKEQQGADTEPALGVLASRYSLAPFGPATPSTPSTPTTPQPVTARPLLTNGNVLSNQVMNAERLLPFCAATAWRGAPKN